MYTKFDDLPKETRIVVSPRHRKYKSPGYRRANRNAKILNDAARYLQMRGEYTASTALYNLVSKINVRQCRIIDGSLSTRKK